MFDARNFVTSLDTAKVKLLELNADFKGEYFIQDAIYRSKDVGQGLDKVFLRLRNVSKNIWNEKQFIVSIKNTEIKEVGKQSIIPVKRQFDSEAEATEFIIENYSNEFEFDFDFNRKGWQYFIGEDSVDLEDIEGHFSIEFKSKTEEGLKKLLSIFNAENIIVGPSVVAVKKLLNKYSGIIKFMDENEFFQVGQKAFIEKDGQVLVLNDPTEGLDYPGGRVQVGETDLIEALKREVREETSLEVEVMQPFGTYIYEFPSSHKEKNKKVFIVCYKCKYVSGDVTLSHEHDNFRWVNIENYHEVDDQSSFFDMLKKYYN